MQCMLRVSLRGTSDSSRLGEPSSPGSVGPRGGWPGTTARWGAQWGDKLSSPALKTKDQGRKRSGAGGILTLRLGLSQF